MICNICGGTEFKAFANRPNAQCVKCYSLERTRALSHIIEREGVLFKGARVLHFAPELGLAQKIKEIVGPDNYRGVDMFPEIFNRAIGVQKFDLTKDIHDLKSGHYDLILHSHVMEHVPCWLPAVFWHLHRALKLTGVQLFCLPIMRGSYSENFSDLSEDQRKTMFGQKDHVRWIGINDLDKTIGTVFRLNEKTYNLPIDSDFATQHGINADEVKRTVFLMRKNDLLLMP